ncbi:uncharacterized protein LOC117321565 [Pecten maximus]|uniref:uncharacterized protein LOC117321565 n=1 Tax=Pecten maximus TaxID=6579 RepID=UPI001458EF23|nr:uncharacterized protein LOC117321565 [Pecten maximus]
MSTPALPNTTSFGYNTTANSTWPEYHGNHSYTNFEMDPIKVLEIKARHIPVIVVSIPSNLFIIAIILGNKNLRTKSFFLGVLSISIFDLCNGVFVLPMSLEHDLHWSSRWNHGEHVCIVFQVLSISKTFLSSLMNIALCIERLLAKLKSVAAISQKLTSTVSGVVIVLPWCLGALVCAPILLSNRIYIHHFIYDQYCMIVLEKASLIPIIVTMYLIPLALLLLVPTVMLLVYKYKNLRRNLLSEEPVKPEAVSLHMSTLSAWIASLCYVTLHGPLSIVITLLIKCTMPDCPSTASYVNAYTVSTITSAVTPFVWIITVEVRAVFSSIQTFLSRMLVPTDGRKSVLSFSSLRNQMPTDDTVVLS